MSTGARELVPRLGKWLYKLPTESVAEFVNRLPPSRTSYEMTPFICAHHEHEPWDPPPIAPKLQLEFDKKVSKEVLEKDALRDPHRIDMESIIPLFSKHKYDLGKWTFLVERDDVDQIWHDVCQTLYGPTGLGCGIAKVSPAHPESDSHVICIYTLNFLMTYDVKRVAEQIRALGITQNLKYKPEAATQLDLYCENERWGPRPTTVYVSIRDRTNVVIFRRAWDVRRQALHHMVENGVFRQC
eukprot:Rhum_TRINITY_DN18942_c0_g1::Rhum_TRINITY_DN18942_c0_g1_i1::g.168745::m.168745